MEEWVQATADTFPCFEGEEDFRLVEKPRRFLPNTIEVVDLEWKSRNTSAKFTTMFIDNSAVVARYKSMLCRTLNQLGKWEQLLWRFQKPRLLPRVLTEDAYHRC